MTNPLPDSQDFYTSPLSDKALVVIGKFITGWAAIESALPMQVARLIASHSLPDAATFTHTAFLRSAAALVGTPAPAALNQIENLAGNRKADVAAAAKIIREIKPKRDVVAHSLATMRGEAVHFGGWGASRIRMGTDKTYTPQMLEGWIDQLRLASLRIDTIVSESLAGRGSASKKINGNGTKVLIVCDKKFRVPNVSQIATLKPPPKRGGHRRDHRRGNLNLSNSAVLWHRAPALTSQKLDNPSLC